MSATKQKTAESVRFEPQQENFQALLVVYKTEEGTWRGFAHPYGETTEASTKDKAIKAIRTLTDAYFRTLKKYGFPAHLVNGFLDNIDDRVAFGQVVSNGPLMKQVHSTVGKSDSPNCYVEAYRNKS